MKAAPRLTPIAARALRFAGDIIAPRGEGQGRLCILNYHRVLESFDPLLASEPDLQTFRWQMELLAANFNVLPLPEAVEALAGRGMPPRAVCISFDDGYASTHDLALPILQELKLPATVFIATGYLDQDNMWNDRIIEAVRQFSGDMLDLRQAGLGQYATRSIEERKLAIHCVTEDSKYLPQDARLVLTLALEQMTGGLGAKKLMLTREQVAKLARAGMAIGGHTVSHPILTRLDDDKAREEIVTGKQQLEAITGQPVRLFAYPNGKAGMDFDARHVAMARDAGFAAAFTTAPGAATKRHDRYQIPRSCPWDATPFLFGARLLRWLARGGT